jgi:hypothetical protein
MDIGALSVGENTLLSAIFICMSPPSASLISGDFPDRISWIAALA